MSEKRPDPPKKIAELDDNLLSIMRFKKTTAISRPAMVSAYSLNHFPGSDRG